MATSPFSPFIQSLLLFTFFHSTLLSNANNIHKVSNFIKTHGFLTPTTTKISEETSPTVYFEVKKPIKLPKTKPCTHHVLQHDFGYTLGKPPVLATYTPPQDCPFQDFSKIILEWKATSKGRQYDRIFGVWLGGVELLRSCTAEPRPNGIEWTVQKDITRYSSMLLKNESQVLAVYLGNLIDSTYTGVYHVNVTVYFYPVDGNSDKGAESGEFKADLILPISRNLPLNDGLWFEIENSTDVESKEFMVPRNVYRAVLEVYISFHENDEFWYGNFPNDYIVANNISGSPGNGPFREVLVSLDGVVVGAVWPFTVVYTGGVNPLFWRPITGIGSFDLPSYDIEITPVLSRLLDGGTHKFGFSVTNALNVWFIDANLHLWLDHSSTKTEAKLVKYESKNLDLSLVSNFKALNGKFRTTAQRSLSIKGSVKSSHGEIITHFTQRFKYHNFMELQKDGNLQIVNQVIDFDDNVSSKGQSSDSHSSRSLKKFHVDLTTDYNDLGNHSYSLTAILMLGFNEDGSEKTGVRSITSSLKNTQDGQGIVVVKNNLVQRGVGSTQQVYKYSGSDLCYSRNIGSSNYTILYDTLGSTCDKKSIFPNWHV